MASTSGRRVVLPLTNKSGGGVIAGDVVIIDTSNDDAFTTTTTAAYTGMVGVVQATIANNAIGPVCLYGEVALVNVSASVTRGNFGATHTVAKQAASAGSARTVGTFVQFKTGGTTPKGLVFNPDLLGTSLTNPMTTKGDVILGDTSGVPSRLGAGTSGYALTSNGAGAFPSWQASAGGYLGTRTEATLSGDVTMTTANTPVDGPTLTPVAGTYDVLARVAWIGTGAGTNTGVTVRLIANGSATPIDEYSMSNNSGSANQQQTAVLTARVVADGSNPVKVTAVSVLSGNDKLLRDAQFNSSATHRATLLVLTRVS